jgi:hypothetical protein
LHAAAACPHAHASQTLRWLVLKAFGVLMLFLVIFISFIA